MKLSTDNLANQVSNKENPLLGWAIEAASEGIWAWHVPTGEAYFSPRYCTMLGYQPAEMNADYESWTKLVHPDDREHTTATISAVLEQHCENYEAEFRLRTKTGDWLWVLGRGKVIDWSEGGKPLVIVGSHLNIDDRKQAEITRQKLQTQLRSTQKLDTLAMLAGGIAHDFNNLLMGIQGRICLISLELGPSSAVTDHLKAVEQHITSATELTTQLLGYAGGGKYEIKPFSLNDLVTETTTRFSHTKKEIMVEQRPAPEPIVVSGDRRQLEQVLKNLYSNSLQAMPGGGRLRVTTSTIRLDDANHAALQLTPGDYAKIEVVDDGVGMDQSTKEKIFEPFFTTKQNTRGAGLGLASAYGIIENHGGIIAVSSAPGQGTTVEIYLPVCDKIPVEEQPGGSERRAGSATILLVDDEQMILDVGQSMLEKLGYQVIAAKGGQAACDSIAQHGKTIDLILLDVLMPDIDGQAVCLFLKSHQPNIPVLLASGYAPDNQAEELMSSGCAGFLQKPYDISELSAKIRQVIDPPTQPASAALENQH